jgi:hypothetical protein
MISLVDIDIDGETGLLGICTETKEVIMDAGHVSQKALSSSSVSWL